MYKQAITIWFDYYRTITGQEYIFDGKDGKHLKLLLKKVEAKVKEKNMEPTEEIILNSLRGFLLSIQDKWILENLELSLVNSKFNSTYAKAVRNSPFTKGQQITDIVNAKYGADPKRATR